MANKKLSLQEQVNIVLQASEERGPQSNFFFVTTFRRYQQQLKMMAELEKEINDLGVTVKKEYVKGRQNVYVNPAISEYNKTATAANNTVACLINILKSISAEQDGGSKLAVLLAGLDDD